MKKRKLGGGKVTLETYFSNESLTEEIVLITLEPTERSSPLQCFIFLSLWNHPVIWLSLTAHLTEKAKRRPMICPRSCSQLGAEGELLAPGPMLETEGWDRAAERLGGDCFKQEKRRWQRPCGCLDGQNGVRSIRRNKGGRWQTGTALQEQKGFGFPSMLCERPLMDVCSSHLVR